MRIALKIVIVFAVVTIAALVVVFGRGPVGPESVVGIEVEQRVVAAGARADASVSAATSGNPDFLKLPLALESKRRFKRMLSSVGVMFSAAENAMQFTLQERHGQQSVRCLVVLRGDHVIGLGVIHLDGDDTFAERVESALGMEFLGYKVQRLRPGA